MVNREIREYDVAIVGAGPTGLACGLHAERHGLSHIVIDKGTLVNTIVGYPTTMTFFSTPEKLELGDMPFTSPNVRPTRIEAIEYYRGVAQREGLALKLYERVTRLSGESPAFTVHTDKGAYQTRNVVIATGFFDIPNRLEAPGADLPKVTHYYREPFAYVGQRVAVVGARIAVTARATGSRCRGAVISPSRRQWGIPLSARPASCRGRC